MLFDEGGQDDPALIDWQGCGIGCGVYDVAFFLGTSVTSDVRRRIERDVLGEYHDIICSLGRRTTPAKTVGAAIGRICSAP